MRNRPLRLMAVHAHPDDEASSTGGILARYAREGIETIVVTCTNGELGDAPGGVKPDEPGFSEELVVRTRRAELDASCSALGVTHLELLGYHDSGMAGWAQNDAPGAFAAIPVAKAAEPLIELFERYQPQVVVTYDANGFYGHPDHIQAHRITIHAVERTRIPAKVYFPAIPRSSLGRFAEALRAGDATASDDPPPDPDFGTPDELVTTFVNCQDVIQAKRAALAAHRSQTESSFFMRIPEDLFNQVFAIEAFVRHHDETNSPVPEEDLFAGLRR